jgi:uncharacterized protein YdeI (YjbR/CyaY-like superfamily)
MVWAKPSAAELLVELAFFASRAEFRAWLERHHTSVDELWVGFHKKASGKDGLTYDEAVEESLCFGWIDGIRRSVDAGTTSQRYTPRRPRSIWSLINVRKFETLEAAGRVTPAGRAAFEARTPERTGVYSGEQADLQLAPEYLARLHAEPAAWAHWESAPKSYRKPATWWVISAKRPETRERRFELLLDCCTRGVKIPLLRRPGEPS